MLLEYFGEAFDRAKCNQTCDNCRQADGSVESVDVSQLASSIVTFINAIHARGVTEALLIKVLMGSQDRVRFGVVFDPLAQTNNEG